MSPVAGIDRRPGTDAGSKVEQGLDSGAQDADQLLERFEKEWSVVIDGSCIGFQ